ncbi:MAG: 50S ribosomal protein L10 [Candidatus Gracilibacteria bacterium]
MAVTRSKKESILADLNDKFAKAVLTVFVKNNGLSMKEINELRALLRQEDATFKIAKKTLMKLAIAENKLPEVADEIFDGPVGVTFGFKDQVSAAKIIANYAKTHDKLELVGGILEGKVLSRDDVAALAKLPGRQELLGMLVGTMQAPIQGFASVLAGNMRNFVSVLDQVAKQKA